MAALWGCGAPPPAPHDGGTGGETGNWWDGAWNAMASAVNTGLQEVTKHVGAALGAALIAAVPTWILAVRRMRRKYRKGPRPAPRGKRACTALVLGAGRTGKTGLIRALLSEPARRPLTHYFELYSQSVDTNTPDGLKHVVLSLSDYRGQSLSQLVQGFIAEQLKENTPLRFGEIDALVLVVDLFEFKGEYRIPLDVLTELRSNPGQRSDDSGTKRVFSNSAYETLVGFRGKEGNGDRAIVEDPMALLRLVKSGDLDEDIARDFQTRYLFDTRDDSRLPWPEEGRVNEQLNEWSGTALDAVWGLLDENMRYVCLWVNKCDMWHAEPEVQREHVHRLFAPLIDRLRARLRGSTMFDVHLVPPARDSIRVS